MFLNQIRRSRVNDAEAFPGIEHSAGLAFRQIPALAWIADDDDLPSEFHRRLVIEGTSWTAVDGLDRPIGFLSAEIFSDNLHIWELSVRLDRQRMGVGRRLIAHAIEEAKARNLASITLTTFIEVPWNAPFYTRVGFAILDRQTLAPRLADLLRQETERGFAAQARCAMRLSLAAETNA
jgi:GNAT superfamily N-acetyltransferase